METFFVGKSRDGISLLEYLAAFLPLSKKEIKRRIENNNCKINDQVEKIASRKLKWNDRIEWIDQAPIQSQYLDLKRILYEDDDLLIYNKPPGVECSQQGIIKLLKNRGQLLLVHRLDKFTSGILILAKNRTSEKILLEGFRDREMGKCYLALVDRVPKVKKGTIKNYLGKIEGCQGQTIYGNVDAKEGKWAETYWAIKKNYKKGALIICYPKTGRTHQIRVHLSEMGCPILGDFQYGNHLSHKIHPPRIMLHAYQIEFQHPIKEKIVKITAPIPKDFQDMILLLS